MEELTSKIDNNALPGKNIIDKVIDGISSIFLPFVNHLSACGILTGIIALAISFNYLDSHSDATLILSAMSGSLFWFLPMLLAFTTASKLQVNPYTSVIIAGILLYPQIVHMMEAGKTLNFFGLLIRPVTYHTSVIPIILAVYVQKYVEVICLKIFSPLVRDFLTPLMCIVFVGTITLMFLGPIGVAIGGWLAGGYGAVYSASPLMAGLVLGGIIQMMVIFGFHWSLVPIAISNIAIHGADTILALMGPAVFAQAGAAFAVALKTQDKALRVRGISGGISALFGITEPAMYGVNLPLKWPMVGVCLGGAIGGAMAGHGGCAAVSFAFPGLATLPVFTGGSFSGFFVSILTGFLVSFAFTFSSRFISK
jgi:PTS system beta-glucosides-specific IIC component